MPPHSRIRILFVIGSMGGGGAERQVLEILKRLDRSRFDPVLYLANKQGVFLSQVPADVPIFAFWDDSPELFIRKLLRRLKLTRIMRAMHLARVLHEQHIDVVYDRTYLATLDAAAGCFFRPTPRISCCVADPTVELELHSRWSICLSWMYARRAYRTARIVLANSEGLRQRMLDCFRLNPDQIKVFYNLLIDAQAIDVQSEVHESEVRERLAQFDDRLAIPNESVTEPRPDGISTEDAPPHANAESSSEGGGSAFLIVSAGRLHPQKGYQFLLEAVDELVHRRGKSVRLVVFGAGEAEPDLNEFIRTHQLETSVLLAGFVADPRRWYRNADLFVLPSLNEGMPNALIEAVATGIPVLACDCPSGPREILDDGRCGNLVAPGDSAALTDGIADAMVHFADIKSRAVLAKRRVEELFEPGAGMRRLETLFEQVSGRHSIEEPRP